MPLQILKMWGRPGLERMWEKGDRGTWKCPEETLGRSSQEKAFVEGTVPGAWPGDSSVVTQLRKKSCGHKVLDPHPKLWMREEGALGQRTFPLGPGLFVLFIVTLGGGKEDKLREGLLILKEPKLGLAMGQPRAHGKQSEKPRISSGQRANSGTTGPTWQESEAKGPSPKIIG